MLFEGRRVRGAALKVILSTGFIQFEKLRCLLIKRVKKDGTFQTVIINEAIASTLVGATKAIICDWLVVTRAGKLLN